MKGRWTKHPHILDYDKEFPGGKEEVVGPQAAAGVMPQSAITLASQEQ